MKILVCTDFSAAAAVGEREAARRYPQATLILFHATDLSLLRRLADQTGRDVSHLRMDVASHADRRLSEIARRLEDDGRAVRSELGAGDPVSLALVTAIRHEVDLIVVGVRRDDPSGSFRARLTRHAHVPVLIVPASE